MTWAQDQRIMWMLKRIQVGETFTRADIGARFNCTIQTASATVAQFQKRHPGIMRYCGRTKAFVPSDHVPDADVSWKARVQTAEADRERLQAELDAAREGLRDGLEAHIELLRRQDAAITGSDISDIRHSDGGIELAKRIVNLQGAAQWVCAQYDQVARALLSDKGEDKRPEPTQDASADVGASCPEGGK